MHKQLTFITPTTLESYFITIAVLSIVACFELALQIDSYGDPYTVDITDTVLKNHSTNCAGYADTYESDVLDVYNGVGYIGALTVEVHDEWCLFTSNSIPNHDFNDVSGFANGVQEHKRTYQVTAHPQKQASATPLTLDHHNAILLNGIKIDLLAEGCYGVGNGLGGCNDATTPWRYDPMFAGNDFGLDSHNGHTQPGGEYHYHGNPKALFDDSDTANVSPVIGFAADGFPILGSYFDDNGTIRKAQSSYQLRSGERPAGGGSPGGTYDGTFVDDYEYIAGSGDLDECNGMTVDGVYGYYVTDTYPYVLGCFRGTP